MRSVSETSAALRALAKVLVDNETRMTEQERESLTRAVFKTIMQRERIPVNGNNKQETHNAITLRNWR